MYLNKILFINLYQECPKCGQRVQVYCGVLENKLNFGYEDAQMCQCGHLMSKLVLIASVMNNNGEVEKISQ
ncbi:hypothetical protein M0R01_04505 [bacterium]|jgi:hypothetical protein|nr:hypothetical protein [bacterium]